MITTQRDNRILWIKMNRPEKRNALNFEMVQSLKKEIQKAYDDKEIKVIVLSGEGKVFCSGADLESLQKMQSFSYDENLADSNNLKELFYLIYSGSKPVIAAVNGHAIAGGAGLLSVCDFAISIPEAKFGFTEVKIGFIPALVMVFLVRKIGEGKARNLLLKGDLISVETASDLGLIHEIVPEKELQNSAGILANKLCAENSGQSMASTKALMAEIQELGLKEGLELAARRNALSRETEDCKKGISSFLNKTKPNW